MTDFIFDRIDAVEEAWTGETAAELLLLDIYAYLELKKALGYSEDDPDITRYHGYKILVIAEAENLIELR